MSQQGLSIQHHRSLFCPIPDVPDANKNLWLNILSSATWHKQQQTESDNGLAAFSHDSLINQSSIMLSRSLCVLALPILHVSPSQQVIKIQSPFTNLNVLSEITESDNGELITCVLNEWNQNFRKPAYEAGKRAQRIQTTKLI
ncbi:hypothetical protein T4C_7836 [Trichinella pseudospiralis]|uniref:Uncharacterized protein n=1 Tax=Trichinella pseudospiralis TaxID=6337 RepID=A0A0V1JYV0_TRIPS|nr:hypothetical protein T4C_7836 [Trichinella pseudospiralis]